MGGEFYLGCANPKPVRMKGHQIDCLIRTQILHSQFRRDIVIRRVCWQVHPQSSADIDEQDSPANL